MNNRVSKSCILLICYYNLKILWFTTTMAGPQLASDFCLLLLIGLPGSGKTTLVNFMEQYFSREEEISKAYLHLNVIHICYDSLITSSLAQQCSTDPDGGIWRDARREILTMVEKLICILKKLPFNNETQRLSLKDGNDNKYIKINCEWEICSSKRTLIVIDDNMYYSSMRYSYFQLARRYCAGFCQLYIKCSVASALQYNKQRPLENRVPEDIIIKMCDRMEPPQVKLWEKCTLSIEAHGPFSNDETVKKIGGMILKAFLNPVPLIDNLSDFGEASREACMASILHQCDLGLRCLVNEQMKLLQQTSDNSDELKAQSRIFKIARGEVLAAIKSRQIVIPNELCVAIQNCDPSAVGHLRNFLSTLLLK